MNATIQQIPSVPSVKSVDYHATSLLKPTLVRAFGWLHRLESRRGPFSFAAGAFHGFFDEMHAPRAVHHIGEIESRAGFQSARAGPDRGEDVAIHVGKGFDETFGMTRGQARG